MAFGGWDPGRQTRPQMAPHQPVASQQAANYRRGYPLRACGTCIMYWHRNTGKQFGGCTKVAGNISPYGLCDFFAQLNNPWGNLMPAQARAQMEQFYDASRGDTSSPTPAPPVTR